MLLSGFEGFAERAACWRAFKERAASGDAIAQSILELEKEVRGGEDDEPAQIHCASIDKELERLHRV